MHTHKKGRKFYAGSERIPTIMKEKDGTGYRLTPPPIGREKNQWGSRGLQA
jgi:hypothetical protein